MADAVSNSTSCRLTDRSLAYHRLAVPSSTLRAQQRIQRDTNRQAILAAADRFLRAHPYRELSVELLMTDTGLARTSFYRHFDDVGQLILDLLNSAGQELIEIAATWADSPPREYLNRAHGALSMIVDFFSRNGPVIGAIVQATSHDERIEDGYREFRGRFVEMTERALGALAVEPAHELAVALNLMNERYLLEAFGDPASRSEPDRVTATLERIWTGAVRGPEHH
jgi:AcrR family transcriptional regulator